MISFIYSIPSWLLAILIVFITVLYAVVGFAIVRKFVPASVRAELNDITAAISAISGIAYAVILAFVGIAAWEAFGHADDIVKTEASSAIDIWLGMRPYPKEFEIKVRKSIEDYVDKVIDEEWELQREGGYSQETGHIIEDLHRFLGDYSPTTMAQHIAHHQINDKIVALQTARRTRLSINSDGIHETVYALIILGTMLVIAFSWVMGTTNETGHMLLTAMLGASIGLIFFLIVSMDWPFRGEFSIGPDPFETVRSQLKRLDVEQPPSEGK